MRRLRQMIPGSLASPGAGGQVKARQATMLMALAAMTAAVPAAMANDPFRLPSLIPDDVFFVTAGHKTPERAFLYDYWGDAWDEFQNSGVIGDVTDLINSVLDEPQRAQFDRLRQRFTQLIEAVDWKQMGVGEVAFAERLPRLAVHGNNVTGGPPDIIVMFRGDPDAAAKNFDGLSAILAAVFDEINTATGMTLKVDQSSVDGVRLTVFDPRQIDPGIPPCSVAVGQYKDVLFLSMGDAIRGDVVNLLLGKGDKQAIGATQRFKTAFEQLREPEDGLLFVDMRTLCSDLDRMMEQIFGVIGADSNDRVENARTNAEANALNNQGFAAYEAKDYDKALDLIEQAHEKAPTDSLVMYNLACMNALLGHKDKALDWLAKSVEAGYYSPGKIADDGDLDSLRDDPRYAAALASAKQHAGVNEYAVFAHGIAKRLIDTLGIIDYVAAVEYTDGYSTYADQVTMLAGDAESNPFYPVISGHKPLGDFAKYLPQETSSFSVNNGFSLDALYKFIEDSFTQTGEPGKLAWAKWGEIQTELGFDVHKDLLDWLDTASVCASFQLDGREAWVCMLEVGNEQTANEKLEYALEKIPPAISEMVAQQPMLAMLTMRTEPTANEDLAGFHDVSLAMMPEPAVVGVRDGWLMLASNEDAALLCLATAAGQHPNVRKNAQVMAEALVPDGPVAAISLTDHRKVPEQVAGMLAGMSMAGGMVSAMIPEPKGQRIVGKIFGIVAKLAPVAAKIDFFKSSAACCQFDGKAYHARKVTHYFAPDERPSAKKAAATAAAK